MTRPKIMNIALLCAVVLLVLFNSCVSPAAGGGNNSASVSAAAVPGWIDKYPSDDAYYIGIGSSSTGNKSQDMEQARAKAKAELAADISVKLKSEQTFYAAEDSTGKAFESAEVQINQMVDKNLEQIETVDSYYDNKIGYWFYLRLNKKTWADIQRREMQKVHDRVMSMILPILNDDSKTVAEKLTILANGWEVLAASPYEGSIKAALKGESGLFIDLLEKQMGYLLNSLKIDIQPPLVNTEPGKIEKIKITVSSTSGSKPGALTVFMATKLKENNAFAQVVTDANGIYFDNIKFTDLPMGKTAVVAKVNVLELGLNMKALKGHLNLPVKDFWVDKSQIKVGLIIESEQKVTGLAGSVKSLFSGDLPFKISAVSSGNRFNIKFQLFIEELPKVLENAPLYVRARAVISLEKDGKTFYSYESQRYKDGGINQQQAYDRAAKKLFAALQKDQEFISGINEAFSFD